MKNAVPGNRHYCFIIILEHFFPARRAALKVGGERHRLAHYALFTAGNVSRFCIIFISLIAMFASIYSGQATFKFRKSLS